MVKSPTNFPVTIDQVAKIAGQQDVYLVGGAVRDSLLGRVSHDFDFATGHDAIGLARRVASALRADFYVLDEAFDSARVLTATADGTREVLDFSMFRGIDLKADLAGRDFTINAMAINLQDRTPIDPLHGASDLKNRRLRACSNAALQEDPIRILRGVRLAAEFDLRIDSNTLKAMKQAVIHLPAVSVERIRDELFRMLEGSKSHASLRVLDRIGVFPYVLPELPALKGLDQPVPHVHDAWEHTVSVVQHLDGILGMLTWGSDSRKTNGIFESLLVLHLGSFRHQLRIHYSKPVNPDRTVRAILFFAALYHDVAKPSTRSVDAEGRIHFLQHEHDGATIAAARCKTFNLSNDEVSRVRRLIEHHQRFVFLGNRMESADEAPSRRAIYRFFRDAGDCGVDLVLLGLADLRAIRGHTLTEETWSAFLKVARILLENYWEKPEETVDPQGLITGFDVMQEFALPPGPTVGAILDAIREAQAAGQVGTREAAIEFGRRWLANNKSKT